MRPPFRVRLWGVRGSVPAPGLATRRHGGNTSCVSVRTPAGHWLVLDAGTGLRGFGDALRREHPPGDGALDVSMLLTHVHWDHVQGLPFFAPLYDPRLRLTVFAPHGLEPIVRGAIRRQICPPSFPVRMDDLASTLAFAPVPPDGLRIRDVTIRAIEAYHPGGAAGWRLDDEHGAPVLAYLPDNEIAEGAEPHALRPTWLAALRGARLLLHDATYVPEETAHHRGWGHSAWDEVVRLAAEAEVERLVLFHHHPDRSDAAVDRIVERARALAASLGSPLRVLAASEQLVLHA